MAVDLRPFRAELAKAEARLGNVLVGGEADADAVALLRRTCAMMAADLERGLWYARIANDGAAASAPQRWAIAIQRAAFEKLFPHLASDEGRRAYEKRRREYIDLAFGLVRSVDLRYRAVVAPDGTRYLVRENPLVLEVMEVVGRVLIAWFESHAVDNDFLRTSARDGLIRCIAERPSLRALLRLAQELPPDAVARGASFERSFVEEAVELAIALVPVVGNVVAAYEAYAAEDLFGYPLGGVERSVLAASVLLPLAGRLVKSGRPVYSEARLAALYGSEARAWEKAIAAGQRARGPALAVLEKAEAALRADKKLTGEIAQEVAQALPKLLRGGGGAGAIEAELVALRDAICQAHPILASLDAAALRRVVERGPNVDHLKGQLLEELIESRVVPWLRSGAGAEALGLARGKPLEFIPGHLIRDANGRQITDGVLAVRDGMSIVIVAVFEAKAGPGAARELIVKYTHISDLTRAERAELRAHAKEILRARRSEAEKLGQKLETTVEEVEAELPRSEKGGQIWSDVQRLSPQPGRGVQVRIGEMNYNILFSPTRTRFFGVVPKNVRGGGIERELRDLGFRFELIGVDIDAGDLASVAKTLQPIAERIALEP